VREKINRANQIEEKKVYNLFFCFVDIFHQQVERHNQLYTERKYYERKREHTGSFQHTSSISNSEQTTT
jgi:hypothetical protein